MRPARLTDSMGNCYACGHRSAAYDYGAPDGAVIGVCSVCLPVGAMRDGDGVFRQNTAAHRLFKGGRTQPLTPVEAAFFGQPDGMVNPQGSVRVHVEIHPAVRERLRKVLLHDERFNGAHGNSIGYSEFISRALDALGCEG